MEKKEDEKINKFEKKTVNVRLDLTEIEQYRELGMGSVTTGMRIVLNFYNDNHKPARSVGRPSTNLPVPKSNNPVGRPPKNPPTISEVTAPYEVMQHREKKLSYWEKNWDTYVKSKYIFYRHPEVDHYVVVEAFDYTNGLVHGLSADGLLEYEAKYKYLAKTIIQMDGNLEQEIYEKYP